MIKRDIIRIPVDHYMAGIRFQVPAHRGEIMPRWQVAYLFAPPPSFGGGFAGAMDAAWGILGNDGLEDRVFGEIERVFTEILPPEMSLETVLEVHKHAAGQLGEMRPESCALLYTALGMFSEAQNVLQAEVTRQRRNIAADLGAPRAKKFKPSWRKVYEDWSSKVGNLERLLERLDKCDPAPIAALLHEWEAIAVKAWGIERYWEPSPFPFELA